MLVLSLFEKMTWIVSHSFILQAVTIRTPERAARGISAISGDNRNIESRSPTEWMMETILVTPPLLMATLVLAIAAVAGIPPKNGMIALPIPCA